MRKTMKKAMAFAMSAIMAVTLVNVPGGTQESATETTAVATAAEATSGSSVVKDPVIPWNSYIAFQINGYWISRDEWTSAKRGKTSTTIDGKADKKYNYLTQFVSNNGPKNNYKGGDLTGITAKFDEPGITANGVTNSVKITGINIDDFKNAGDAESAYYNMLHVSTEIPLTQKNVKCTDVTVKVDGKVVATMKEVPHNQEKTATNTCYDFMLVDEYGAAHKTLDGSQGCKAYKPSVDAKGKPNSDAAKLCYALPKESIEISYTLSGVTFYKQSQADEKDKNSVATYNGKSVGQSFTKGDYKYKVVTRSKSDGTKGTVAVNGLSAAGKKKTTLSIPATVKYSKDASYKVMKITAKAFQKNKKIKKVTLNNNMTSVPAKAFMNCTKLTTVKFGKKITSIGASAFSGCKSIKKVTLGAKTKTIGAKAFAKCVKLNKIAVSQKVKLAKKAFTGCKKTIKVTGKKANKKFTVAQIKKSGYKKVK